MRERIEQKEIFKNEVEAARAKAKANVYALREAEKDALQATHDKVWTYESYEDFLTFPVLCI